MIDEGQQHERRAPIDWDAVRARVEEVRSRIERTWQSDPAEQEHILAERARSSAQELQTQTIEETGTAVVEFLLGDGAYGIGADFVREICPLVELTPLPGTPDFVEGIMNVRGEIVSIIDLRKYLGLVQRGLSDSVIILRSAEIEFGILADKILGVRWITEQALQPAISDASGPLSSYLLGITDDRCVILDAASLLRDRRLIVEDGD